MGKKLENWPVFPGEIYPCSSCGKSNVFFIEVSQTETASLAGDLCPHVNSKPGLLDARDARVFLEVVIGEAQEFSKEARGERKRNILSFIVTTENALNILKKAIIQRKQMAGSF